MILFRTDVECTREYQEALKVLYQKRLRKFLLLPRWLDNGQLAWLQYVYKDYNVTKDVWNEYCREIRSTYHLEDRK